MTRPPDPVPLPWYVVLEENIGTGEYKNWAITWVIPCQSRGHAQLEAQAQAHNYKPTHPRAAGNRMVFRTGDDVWTTWVDGATRRYHFRVSVAQREA